MFVFVTSSYLSIICHPLLRFQPRRKGIGGFRDASVFLIVIAKAPFYFELKVPTQEGPF